MVDSVSGIANAALAMQQQKIAQQAQMVVMVKAQDIQKQQGEQVLQLLDSTQATATPSGVDIRV